MSGDALTQRLVLAASSENPEEAVRMAIHAVVKELEYDEGAVCDDIKSQLLKNAQANENMIMTVVNEIMLMTVENCSPVYKVYLPISEITDKLHVKTSNDENLHKEIKNQVCQSWYKIWTKVLPAADVHDVHAVYCKTVQDITISHSEKAIRSMIDQNVHKFCRDWCLWKDNKLDMIGHIKKRWLKWWIEASPGTKNTINALRVAQLKGLKPPSNLQAWCAYPAIEMLNKLDMIDKINRWPEWWIEATPDTKNTINTRRTKLGLHPPRNPQAWSSYPAIEMLQAFDSDPDVQLLIAIFMLVGNIPEIVELLTRKDFDSCGGGIADLYSDTVILRWFGLGSAHAKFKHMARIRINYLYNTELEIHSEYDEVYPCCKIPQEKILEAIQRFATYAPEPMRKHAHLLKAREHEFLQVCR